MFSVVVALLAFLIGQFVYPYCKGFRWDDATISMPYAQQETFPTWSLVPIVIVPVCLETVVIFFVPRKHFMFPLNPNTTPRRQLMLEVNSWALIQVQALMLQLMFVDTMKLYAGRIRPDFLSRLESIGIAPGPGIQFHCELMSNSFIREGRLSFPSGHSSTSFAAMIPFSVFMMHHLRPWLKGCIIRMVACILPLYISFIVAVSRTRDNRHHFSDILAGSLIGTFAAIGAFWINLRYSPADGYFDARNDAAPLEEGILNQQHQQQVVASFGTSSSQMRGSSLNE